MSYGSMGLVRHVQMTMNIRRREQGYKDKVGSARAQANRSMFHGQLGRDGSGRRRRLQNGKPYQSVAKKQKRPQHNAGFSGREIQGIPKGQKGEAVRVDGVSMGISLEEEASGKNRSIVCKTSKVKSRRQPF